MKYSDEMRRMADLLDADMEANVKDTARRLAEFNRDLLEMADGERPVTPGIIPACGGAEVESDEVMPEADAQEAETDESNPDRPGSEDTENTDPVNSQSVEPDEPEDTDEDDGDEDD